MQIAVIENEHWQVGILPELGASTAFGRIQHEGAWRDVLHPMPKGAASAWDVASYLLIPWSNRVKDGEFCFQGKRYRLRINSGDRTAIHGAARDFPWEVVEADRARIVLRFDSRNFAGVNFPWQFSATAIFAVEDRRLVLTLQLTNQDQRAMPGGFGHHPYFVRHFASAEDGAQVQIPCEQYFVAEKCIPSGAAIAVEPRVDYRALRPLALTFIDDNLTGRNGAAPIRMVYSQSGRALRMTADPIFEHVVFYNPTEKPYFAIEPVTNANDGFNLYDRGVSGSGVFVLAPGETRSGVVTLEIEN